MAEAVQVVVRGFKSQPSGNMIVSRLEGAGFSIKEKWECGCDGCRGGSIETEITATDQLACAPEALLPLLPFLPLDRTIWECACGKGYLVEALRHASRKVIATDKKMGKDFLTWQPSEWHCIVTNPPFSLKNEFLARAYAFGKPFAFLLPYTALESQPRQELFRRNGIQLIVLNERIHFENPNQKASHSWFPVAWFCWGLGLPKQLNFVDQYKEGESTMNNMVKPYTMLSEIEPQSAQWLWPLRIPFGELTVLDGDPGTNKSSLTLDLAARVSTGSPMPDQTKRTRRGGVLLLVAEDSLRKTLVFRLKAAGADMTRIAALKESLTIPADLGVIEEAVRRTRAKLLIIDPLMAFLGKDSNNDQQVRQALMPLRTLAERTNIAVILVRHLNKSGGQHSLYRGSGSIGIIGTTRSGLLVGNHPEDQNMRVLCQTKNNLGHLAPTLLFEPVMDDSDVVRIEWRGVCDYTADDLLKLSNGHEDKLDKARKFLLDALADAPVECNKLKGMAAQAAIAWRTIERAKEMLGVISRRKGWGPGSKCLWEMASHDDDANA